MIAYTAKASLANGIAKAVGTGDIPPSLVIDSRVSGSDALIEVLTPYAKRIVRGIR
jgi:hypothetical protein